MWLRKLSGWYNILMHNVLCIMLILCMTVMFVEGLLLLLRGEHQLEKLVAMDLSSPP